MICVVHSVEMAPNKAAEEMIELGRKLFKHEKEAFVPGSWETTYYHVVEWLVCRRPSFDGSEEDTQRRASSWEMRKPKRSRRRI